MAPRISDQQANPALDPIFRELEATFSQNALKEIEPTLRRDVTSASQNGNQLTLNSDTVHHIPMSAQFLNGNIKLKAVDVGTIKCDIDQTTHSATNVQGISLNLDVFGSPYSLPVKTFRLGQDPAGRPMLFTDVANPLPDSAQRILGMQPTIAVAFPVSSEGVKSPALSTVFADAAKQTGPSIAGLLAADALGEASKVSLFAESNPKWTQQIVEPALRDVYKTVTEPHAGARPAPVAAQGNRQIASAQKPSGSLATPGDHSLQMVVDGVPRDAEVHVPPSYDGKTPMPVVILLHGQGQDGNEIANMTHFRQMADKKGFIAVFPNSRTWLGNKEFRTWDTDNGLIPPGQNADDVGFLRNLIDTTQKDFAIDPKRIYMAGMSNGGMLTFRAAGELSDKLAAVAIVSGAMSGVEPPLKEPVSMINIHGTDDQLVPYDGLKNMPASLKAIGLPNFKPTQYATNWWVEQNEIKDPPTVIDNQNTRERKFLDTKSGTEVDEYTLKGDDHFPDHIDAVTNTIWDFFAAHPKVSGPVSGTRQPVEQPFDLTERIKQHINSRGMRGLEMDAGQMINETHNLVNGSFSPSNIMSLIENRSGIRFNDPVSNILKNTKDISKQGDDFSIDMAAPQTIKIDDTSGPVKVASVTINDTKFHLAQENGRPSLRDISGVSFGVNALGHDMSVGVTEATQKLDASGNPYYHLTATNPLGPVARTLLWADKEVPVEVRLNQNGTTTVLNEKEMKNAALGVNPIIRGDLDIASHIGNLYTNPSLSSSLNVAKDLGIIGMSGYGAYRLALMRLGTRGSVGAAIAAGALIAPAIIHGIEEVANH